MRHAFAVVENKIAVPFANSVTHAHVIAVPQSQRNFKRLLTIEIRPDEIVIPTEKTEWKQRGASRIFESAQIEIGGTWTERVPAIAARNGKSQIVTHAAQFIAVLHKKAQFSSRSEKSYCLLWR